jgi:hypothetical protein
VLDFTIKTSPVANLDDGWLEQFFSVVHGEVRRKREDIPEIVRSRQAMKWNMNIDRSGQVLSNRTVNDRGKLIFGDAAANGFP